MISWFKKYFVPHDGNNNQPHFLRDKNTRNVILVVLFVELAIFILPTTSLLNFAGVNFTAAVLPAVLDDLTNQNRHNANLPSLKESTLLDQAAQLKATDMSTKGYFAHNSPDGKTPWYWFNLVGYKYTYAGENLAINFTDSQDVANAWMNSPTHRANILKGGYTEVGTGLSTGIYNGREAIYVVQLYASPQIAPVAVITPKPVAPIPTKVVATAVTSTGKVLGESTTSPAPVVVRSPTFIEKLLASPHQTTNTILITVLILAILANILNIFIKVKVQHPKIITNGLLLLAVVIGIYLLNNYYSNRNSSIDGGSAYSQNSLTSQG